MAAMAQRWLLDQSREASKAASEQSRKLREEAAPAGNRKEDRKAAAAARQARADEIKPLKKELTLTDHRLGVLFAERDKLEASFADASLSPEQIAEAGKRLKTVNEDIERLEGRWLELSTRIDELGAAA